MAEKGKRGFAAMDRDKQRQIASLGGKAAHRKGTAHEFTSEEAREAGRKGGQAAHEKGKAHVFTPEEAREAGRKGGQSTRAARSGAPLGEDNPSERALVQSSGVRPENGAQSSSLAPHAMERPSPPETTLEPTDEDLPLLSERRNGMTSSNEEVIDVLNNLIETCKDRQYGYQTAADAVENNEFQTLFRAYAKQSGEYAAELQIEVRRLGSDPERGGSMAGWFLRGWMNLKSAVTGGDESALIAECERGEDSAKSNYENALKEFLPADVQALIQRQFAGIREGHDRMRSLELSGASHS